jgi:hypothetical protein
MPCTKARRAATTDSFCLKTGDKRLLGGRASYNSSNFVSSAGASVSLERISASFLIFTVHHIHSFSGIFSGHSASCIAILKEEKGASLFMFMAISYVTAFYVLCLSFSVIYSQSCVSERGYFQTLEGGFFTGARSYLDGLDGMDDVEDDMMMSCHDATLTLMMLRSFLEWSRLWLHLWFMLYTLYPLSLNLVIIYLTLSTSQSKVFSHRVCMYLVS